MLCSNGRLSHACTQFEKAAVEVLDEHFSEAGAQVLEQLKVQGVHILLYSSETRTASLTASIRDLSVRVFVPVTDDSSRPRSCLHHCTCAGRDREPPGDGHWNRHSCL